MELMVSFGEIKDVFDPVSQVNKFLLFCFGDCRFYIYVHAYNSHEYIKPTKHVTIIKSNLSSSEISVTYGQALKSLCGGCVGGECGRLQTV